MKNNRCLPDLCQIVNGLQHLHYLNIVHCNIRPSSILLTSRGVVKLSGFSRARCVERVSRTPQCKGSIKWSAPETHFNGNIKHIFAIDTFSLGCVFGYLLSGCKHIFGFDRHHIMFNIARGNIQQRVLWKINNDTLCKLVINMTNYIPETRPILTDVFIQLKHEC